VTVGFDLKVYIHIYFNNNNMVTYRFFDISFAQLQKSETGDKLHSMIGHRSSSMKEGWDCDYDYQSIILRGYMYKYTCFSFHTKINKQKT
jgi:hypothetical protein